jgi:hypothetical protein
MPALFLSSLIGALAAAMGTLAGRVLLALGFGFVTYKGVDLGIASLKAQVISSVQGLSADALSLVGYLWLDKALTVVFSSVVVAMTMRALGGSIKKLVAK